MTKRCNDCNDVLALEWLERHPDAVRCKECFFWASVDFLLELPMTTRDEVNTALLEAGLDPKTGSLLGLLLR